MSSLATKKVAWENPTDKIKELEEELAKCKVARDEALAEIKRRNTSGHQKKSNQEETWNIFCVKDIVKFVSISHFIIV